MVKKNSLSSALAADSAGDPFIDLASFHLLPPLPLHPTGLSLSTCKPNCLLSPSSNLLCLSLHCSCYCCCLFLPIHAYFLPPPSSALFHSIPTFIVFIFHFCFPLLCSPAFSLQLFLSLASLTSSSRIVTLVSIQRNAYSGDV